MSGCKREKKNSAKFKRRYGNSQTHFQSSLHGSVSCRPDQGHQTNFWIEIFKSVNEKRKSQHKFHWSTEGVLATLLKCWANGLFGRFDVQQQVFPTSHTCVCSCCCERLGCSDRREGPRGFPRCSRSCALTLRPCVQCKMKGISSMRLKSKSLVTAVSEFSTTFLWSLWVGVVHFICAPSRASCTLEGFETHQNNMQRFSVALDALLSLKKTPIS